MMPLPLSLALGHLKGRKRQSLVSILGVTLGVAIFIAVSGLLRGFQAYFLTQLIETNPHIAITDEIRRPPPQPLTLLVHTGAVAVTRIMPRDPVGGIHAAGAIVAALEHMPGVHAAPTLRGQAILRHTGRDYAVTGLGIDPLREPKVTTLSRDMQEGSIQALAGQPDGLIIGRPLADKMGVKPGDTVLAIAVSSSTVLRIVGIFRTGVDTQDESEVYLSLVRQQAMQQRPRVVNEIHVRLDDISQSIPFAAAIEGRWGYKAAPWEETFRRILSVFLVQNVIIYGTTGAILLVAAFGIFNIISTVVLEKSRDIAILRSIGLPRTAVVTVFVVEGVVVGMIGVAAGCLLGCVMAALLGCIPDPGSADPTKTFTVVTGPEAYGAACAIGLVSAVVASWLPARRAAKTDPLQVIRGAA